MYQNGECKTKKEKFRVGDLISVTLDIPRGEVRFYKNKWLENPAQFTFDIEKGAGFIYKLAVSLKDAQVSIIGFEYELQSESKEPAQSSVEQVLCTLVPLTLNFEVENLSNSFMSSHGSLFREKRRMEIGRATMWTLNC